MSMYSLVPICEIQEEILINESAALLWDFVMRSAWRVASFNLINENHKGLRGTVAEWLECWNCNPKAPSSITGLNNWPLQDIIDLQLLQYESLDGVNWKLTTAKWPKLQLITDKSPKI